MEELVRAEDDDVGGFSDTTPGNAGGVYRTDDVDIEKQLAGLATPNVGWVRSGEYLTYTATVHAAGAYIMTARVASPNSGRTIALSVDGIPTATIAVPNTGSFAAFTTVPAPVLVILPAGVHTLKLTFQGDGQNIDWIAFGVGTITTPTTPVQETGGASFTAAPISAPKGSAVMFAVTPASGKRISAAWWTFDSVGHYATWNSRAVSPTFYYPARGSFSPLGKLTYTDGSTETVQRANYIRAT